MRQLIRFAVVIVALVLLSSAPTRAQQAGAAQPPHLPFVETLSNHTPLAFGMDAAATARALGQPLRYVSGRPGNEIYLAIRNDSGSGLMDYPHRLFLQFRQGRLSGWKGDWGKNWMWE